MMSYVKSPRPENPAQPLEKTACICLYPQYVCRESHRYEGI